MVGVVQLVERQVVILNVAGSSPVTHPKGQRAFPPLVVFFSGCTGGCDMSEDHTPEEQLAEVALAALSGGLYAFEHDNQLQAQQLREQLDLLGKWAVTNNDPDGRMLQSVAMALRLLSNGGVTGIVRRIAATLQKRM
jgi:hypothetical protein